MIMFIRNASHCEELMRKKPRPILRTILQMKGYGFTPKTNAWFGGKKKIDIVKEIAAFWAEHPEQVTKAIEIVTAGGAPNNDQMQQEIVGEVADIKQAEKEALEKIAAARDEASTAASSIKETAIADARTEIAAAINRSLERMNSSPQQLADRVLERSLAIVEEAVTKKINEYRPIVVKSGASKVKLKGKVLCDKFERLLQLTGSGKNILMVGPAGCGKTVATEHLAEALGITNYAAVSCSMGMSESQLVGRMLPTGKGGAFEYHASPFVDIYENGGLFVLDEIDAADPNVLVALNTALAGKMFSLPQRLGNSTVKRHPDFRCVACANTYGHGADVMYVGRNQLDAATLDRFRIGTVTMNYSQPIEKSITAEAPWVYDWAVSIRQKIAGAGLRRIMSTRTMVDAMDMVINEDWKQEDLEEGYFADWTNDERLRLVRAA